MPLVAAVAVIIILVIAVVASREQRQAGEPEQPSPSSIDAPLGPFRGALAAGSWLLPGHFPAASPPPGQPWPAVPGTTCFFQSLNR